MNRKNSKDPKNLKLPDAAEYERRGAVFAEYLERERPAGARGRRRAIRSGLLAISVLGVATGIATAAGLFSKDEIATGLGISCYAKPTTDSNSIGLPTDPDPVRACAEAWKKGVVTGDPRDPNLVVPDSVPPMVACVSSGEGVRVFPGPGFRCKDLGLYPLPLGYADLAEENVRVEAVLQRVSKVVERRLCVSPERLSHRAERALAAEGLDLSVPVVGDEPCANSATTMATGRPQIETLARIPAMFYVLLTRAMDVQGDLDRRLGPGCVDPGLYVDRFREALRRKHLELVKVRVDDRSAKCLDRREQMSNWEEPAIDLYTR